MGLNHVKTKLLLALVISTLMFLAIFGVSKQFSFAQSQNGQTYSIPTSYSTTAQSNQSTNPLPTSVNHPPIVSNVTGISTPQDNAVAIPIIISDPDQGDSATITNKSSPAHGRLSLGSTQNSFVYTPTSRYFGQDSFNIQATDNHEALSNIATVSITITPSASAGGGYSSSGQGFDKFSIKEIYPTKPGGEQWFMNMQIQITIGRQILQV